jgi:hypothetical protein
LVRTQALGIGAGFPIAWQGWALIAAFLLFLLLTGVLIEISRRRTRGGWRWRWGERD